MKRTALYNIVTLIFLALTLSACGYLPAPGPECVSASSFGDINTKTVTVNSNTSGWFNTGISVQENSSIVQMEVLPGAIILCGSSENTTMSPDSNNEGYVTPPGGGPRLRQNDQFVITKMTGGYNRWGNNTSSPNCSSYSDSNCWLRNGMGLNMRVGTSGPILPSASIPNTWANTIIGMPLDTSSLSGTSLTSLYFSYYDTSGDFGDNAGDYVLTYTHYGCPHYNGENLRAYISDNNPGSSRAIGETINLGPDSPNYGQSTEAPSSGNIWLKIYDLNNNTQAMGDGNYSNNIGSYQVKITVVTQPKAISNAINWLVDGVKGKLETAREMVYRNMITSQTARIARAMLALYIIIYGIMFIYGMIEHTQMDFLIRVVKIAIIIQLTSAGSWDFFNKYIFTTFTDGSSYLIHIMSNAYSSSPVTSWSPEQGIEWTFLDQTFSQLFSQTTWIKLAGLLFAFPLGILYLLLIIFAMAAYIIAVAWVVLAYLLSLVALSLLIAVAPFFIICLLFTKTADLFKKWLNQLFNYALQPVILVALLVIFNFFIIAALLRILDFNVCWKCIWSVNIGFDLCLWSFYIPTQWVASDPINTLPITIISILILIMFVKILPKLIMYAEQISKQLTSSPSSISLVGMSKQMQGDASEKMKGLVGIDKQSRQRRAGAKANQKLRARATKELAEEDKASSKKGNTNKNTDD